MAGVAPWCPGVRWPQYPVEEAARQLIGQLVPDHPAIPLGRYRPARSQVPRTVSPGAPVAGRGCQLCRPARVKNSARDRPSARSVPSMVEVMVVEPAACTPRSVMQVCSASITTPMPRGCS
jgi:hypothetical protein